MWRGLSMPTSPTSRKRTKAGAINTATSTSRLPVIVSPGTFHLVKQPPPESLHAGIFDRLSALVDSVRH